MDCHRQRYLLYTSSEIGEYRGKYAAFVRKYGERYMLWFRSLPILLWVPLPEMDEQTSKAVIGLLCILHIDGLINLTVNNDVTQVYRSPLTDDEFEEYFADSFMFYKK